MTYVTTPPQLVGGTSQQIADIHTYLFRLSQQLNLNFENASPMAVWQAAATAIDAPVDTGLEDSSTLSNYQQLRSLVIKTADYAAANSEKLSLSLSGNYVAKSEFGKYEEKTKQTLEANSTGITQLFDYAGSLGYVTDYDGINFGEIETYKEAYIKSGLLYYEGSEPIYGVGVGNITFTAAENGQTVIDTGNTLATFSSTELAFWNGGAKVGYVSGGQIHFPAANITGGEITIGDNFHVSPSGVLKAFEAAISGTLTAGSGSKIGSWNIGTAIYSGKTTLDNETQGLYLGTDGIAIGTTDKLFKVLPDGTFTATGANIKGKIEATELVIGDGVTISGGTIDANSTIIKNLSADYITSGYLSADRIKGGTIDGDLISVTNLNASNIIGGTLDCNYVDVTNLSADSITTGTLSSARIKLGGELTVFQTAYSSSIGGYLGYASGTYGSKGIGMRSQEGTSKVMALESGAKLVCSLSEVTASDTTILLKAAGNDGVYLNASGDFYSGGNGTHNLGLSGFRWDTVYASGGVSTTSDRKKKRDISYDVARYLQLLKKLKPAIYKLLDGTSGRDHFGFIAQDVEEAMKECGISDMEFAGLIKTPNGDDYDYSLRYGEFIPMNTLAILDIYEILKNGGLI